MLRIIQKIVDDFIVPKYIGYLQDWESCEPACVEDFVPNQIFAFNTYISWRELECFFGETNDFVASQSTVTTTKKLRLLDEIPNYSLSLVTHFFKGYMESYLGELVTMSLFCKVECDQKIKNLGYVSFRDKTLFYLV